MASLAQKRDCKNWIACFTLPDGTRTQRSTGTTDRKLAQKIADEFAESADKAKKNQFVESAARRTLNEILRRVGEETMNGDTVEHFLREWLAGKSNEGTNQRYMHVIDVFLKHLGGKSQALLSAISHKDAQSFIRGREKTGLASVTVSLEAKILLSAFALAKKMQFIEHNPFEKALAIKPIKTVSSKRKPFTPQQIAQILHTAEGEWKTLILLGFFTGARLGDCAKMKWDNVDFNKRMISFLAKKTENSGGEIVHVPMTVQLEEHLQKIASTDSTNPFICPTLSAKKVKGNSGLSESFGRIMVKAGVDPQIIQGQGKKKFSQLSFHSLRHANNTELRNNGVDQETRMKITGHKSKQINDGYTHIDVEKLRGAVDKLILPPVKITP